MARGGRRDVLAASAMAKRYIGIVAEEDLSRVDGSRRDPEKVKAVIESLARNESTLATLKTLVADLGGEVSRQTAASYISLLARVSFVRDIPAWNPAMRSPVHLREAKKHHLADPSPSGRCTRGDSGDLAVRFQDAWTTFLNRWRFMICGFMREQTE